MRRRLVHIRTDSCKTKETVGWPFHQTDYLNPGNVKVNPELCSALRTIPYYDGKPFWNLIQHL